MTSSIRYKFIKNDTVAPFTLSTFPGLSDGDDKQVKFVRHVLTATDIGNAPGQTGHANGLILDFVNLNYNILWVNGATFRPTNKIDGIQFMLLVDNGAFNGDEANIQYGVGADGSIRVEDVGYGTGAALLADDVVTAIVIIGPKVDQRDSV